MTVLIPCRRITFLITRLRNYRTRSPDLFPGYEVTSGAQGAAFKRAAAATTAAESRLCVQVGL